MPWCYLRTASDSESEAPTRMLPSATVTRPAPANHAVRRWARRRLANTLGARGGLAPGARTRACTPRATASASGRLGELEETACLLGPRRRAVSAVPKPPASDKMPCEPEARAACLARAFWCFRVLLRRLRSLQMCEGLLVLRGVTERLLVLGRTLSRPRSSLGPASARPV